VQLNIRTHFGRKPPTRSSMAKEILGLSECDTRESLARQRWPTFWPPRSQDITPPHISLRNGIKGNFCATAVTALKIGRHKSGMSSQQSTVACWLQHGKNRNFNCMFSVRHRVPKLNCAECMKKQYTSNKISFTFSWQFIFYN
jgi:hypothetical protein